MKNVGVCVLTNTTIPGMEGTIRFHEKNKKIIVSLDLKNVPPGKHGIHIHEAGDLTESCKSVCKHFNPKNNLHGGPKDKKRHIGDLGNIIIPKSGRLKKTFIDDMIKLSGKYSIIGRSVVIHENEDDLGKGGIDKKGNIINLEVYNESKKTGNAGKRIACGVIGYSASMFK